MQCKTQIILRGKSNQAVPLSGKTPTTQGLVERSNKTWKENMRSIIMGSNNKNIERWCEYTMQASYTMNITLHRAINTTPYEAVFGITAHRENHQNTDEDIKGAFD